MMGICSMQNIYNVSPQKVPCRTHNALVPNGDQRVQNFSIENQSVAPMTCLDLVTSLWLPVSCP
ncbi:MAG: hypothetical protein ACK55Z_24605, partial [bacterium]